MLKKYDDAIDKLNARLHMESELRRMFKTLLQQHSMQPSCAVPVPAKAPEDLEREIDAKLRTEFEEKAHVQVSEVEAKLRTEFEEKAHVQVSEVEAKLRTEFEEKARVQVSEVEAKLRTEFEEKARVQVSEVETKLRTEFEEKARVQVSELEAKRTELRVHARKLPIPKNVRTAVWKQWIGGDKGEAQCVCCGTQTINQGGGWHCGHVVAESNGGDSSIYNLRPICAPCNHGMKTTNMRDFMRRYFPARLFALDA